MKTTQQKIEDLQKQIDDLKASVKVKIEVGITYLYFDDRNSAMPSRWDNCETDNYRLNTGNVFLNREEAQAKQTYNTALAEVNKFIREEGLALENVDWGDFSQGKWYFYYDYNDDIFEPCETHQLQEIRLLPYLKSKEACDLLIEKQKSNLLILMGK